MGCLSMRVVVHCSAGTGLLLVTSLLAFGCSRSFGPSSEEAAAATTDGGGSVRPNATGFAEAATGRQDNGSAQPPDSSDAANARRDSASTQAPDSSSISGPQGAQGDSGAAQPPPALDAGPRPSDARTESDANDGTQCAQDRDCPITTPCYRPYCGSLGYCVSDVLPDGTSCASPTEDPWICIGGSCQESRCGDGFIDPNLQETCDDGNSDTTDACPACEEARCGDGYVQTEFEMCEPLLDPTCKEDCTPAVCGDGVIEAPVENCEPDTATGPCNDVCRISDSPEWIVELLPLDFEMGLTGRAYPVLLLDGAGNPIVVHSVVNPARPGSGEVSTALTEAHKFDAAGHRVWSWRGSETVTAWSAEVDRNDNVIIGGDDWIAEGPWLVKLDHDGQQQWSTSLHDPGYGVMDVATDDQADIVAMVSPDARGFMHFWCTVDPRFEVFDSDGNHRPGEQLTLTDVVVNGEALNAGVIGGVNRYLIAGATESFDPREPYLVLLNSDLTEVWDAPLTYSSPEPEVGFIRAMATDDGDIITLGASRLEGEPHSFWWERFGPEGTPRWTEAKPLRSDTGFFYTPDVNLTGTISSFPHFPMAVDAHGSLYLSLQDAEAIDGRTCMLIDKYGSDGSPSWQRPLLFDSGNRADPSTNLEYALGLAVDGEGAIYVLSTRLLVMVLMRPMAAWSGLWLHKWRQPK